MHWTHFTLPLGDLEGSIKFFTEVCGLAIVRDRRLEGGSTVWLGPKPAEGADPEFALVAYPNPAVNSDSPVTSFR